MLAVYLACALAAALAAVFLYLRNRYAYWERRGVVHAKPSIPFGNYADTVLGKRTMSAVMGDIYSEFRGERYVGTHFLATPLLQIQDPDIIRQVFIKEFQDFNGRGMFSDPENDPLSGHLFGLSGTLWRNLRVQISPTFTSGKIKYMFSTISQCADYLNDYVVAAMERSGGAYEEDIREVLARFSTDIISSVAFGIESNSMKTPDSEFRRMGQRVFDPSPNVSLRNMLAFFGADIMRLFRIRSVPYEVHEFFTRIVGETVQYREQNKVERADMLNLFIKLKNEGFIPPDAASEDKNATNEHDVLDEDSVPIKEKVSLNTIIGQVFVFFVAGFETTSTTSSFTLYELAKHPDILEKVLEELDTTLEAHGGKITYEMLTDLPYLEKVIQETLRHYPAVPFLTREAMVRRKLPLTDLVVDKGLRLLVPVHALHMDPEYWPEPKRFDPERFTEEAKKTRPSAVYLPFGDGPRICIGMRLGLVQVKMALATILSRARVTLAPGMPLEPVISPRSIVPSPVHGCRLVLTAR